MLNKTWTLAFQANDLSMNLPQMGIKVFRDISSPSAFLSSWNKYDRDASKSTSGKVDNYHSE